jgi:hypothetical protein
MFPFWNLRFVIKSEVGMDGLVREGVSVIKRCQEGRGVRLIDSGRYMTGCTCLPYIDLYTIFNTCIYILNFY